MSLPGLLALALHAGLLGVGSILLMAARPLAAARLAGRAGPPVWQALRDLRRLICKQPSVAEGSLLQGRLAITEVIAAALAALLVPSFATGMATAPLSDLVVLACLLAASRLAPVLGALESGSARSGVRAADWMRQFLAVQPSVIIAVMAIGVLAGTTNLDAALPTMPDAPPLPLVFAAAALFCLACSLDDDPVDECSAWHLAASRIAATLRRVVWLNLAGALMMPGSLAPAESGATAWLLALTGWTVKSAVLGGGLVVADAAAGQRGRWHGAAAVFAVAGLLFVFARQAPA